MTEEIKKTIADESDKYSFNDQYGWISGDIADAFAKGAEFGYSLALPTIQAQEERIRVLEEALKEIRDRGYTGAYMIAHEALIKSKALTLNL